MKYDSPHWNLNIGVCEKHMLPSVPCPSCMAGDGDEDVTFRVEEIDLDVIADENFRRKKGEPPFTWRDLVPSNFKNPQRS